MLFEKREFRLSGSEKVASKPLDMGRNLFSPPPTVETQMVPLLSSTMPVTSLDEIEIALENDYKTITLGENRLRTETAALFACMNAKLLIG